MAKENRFSGLMSASNRRSDSDNEKSVEQPESSSKKNTKKAKYLDKSNYKQVGLYLPVDVHQRMKIGAAMTGREMSEIAAEGIKLWLEKNVPSI